MSKKATRLKLVEPVECAALMLAAERALKTGKAGYKRSDTKTRQLIAEMRAGRLQLGQWIDVGNGNLGRLVDKFAEVDEIGTGQKVRRYEVEIMKADDIAKHA